MLCSGWLRVYRWLTFETGHNLCCLLRTFDLIFMSMDPNTLNTSLNTIRWWFIGLCSQSCTQGANSINVIKDLKVSTGAIQMLPYSCRADRALCQHPWFYFYKNVFLCAELLLIVLSGDSAGKGWHISYELARGPGFLSREISFTRGTVCHA